MTSSSTQNVAIAYMPHLCMGGINEIDFGFLKIWNFTLKKNQYIPDVAVRTHIEKILGTHKSHHASLDNIGVITIGQADFREFNEADFEKIRLARLILFFACVAKTNIHKPDGNVGFSMVTAENFDLIYQRFVVGDNHISESSGAIVRMTAGGFNLGTINFQKPSFVLSPTRFELDKEAFDALLELQTKKPRVFNRVVNSIGIFFEGYHNAENVSRNARILLQMSAFEILLNLPNDGHQRKNFKDQIGFLANKSTDKTYIHKYERRGQSKGVERITIKQIWADSFYTLRNHIIHGETPKPQSFLFRNVQQHTDVGLLFFILCVKKQIGVRVKKFLCTDEINWEKWKNPQGMRPPAGEGFVYKKDFPQLWKALAAQLPRKKK